MPKSAATADVRAFWESTSCGEVYSAGATLGEQLAAQARARYALEPYIPAFARFSEGRGRDILEIGVGMGADHLEWARAQPRALVGVDLTDRAVRFTQARLVANGVARTEEKLPNSCRPSATVYAFVPGLSRCVAYTSASDRNGRPVSSAYRSHNSEPMIECL